MALFVTSMVEEELKLIKKAHQDKLRELTQAFDKAKEDLRKELECFSSFEIVGVIDNHGGIIYYRRYKDGRLSHPSKDRSETLQSYLDGDR